jgi:hypothetical protein
MRVFGLIIIIGILIQRQYTVSLKLSEMISPAVAPTVVYSVRTQFDSQRGFECYSSRFYNFPQPSQLNSVVRPVHRPLPHFLNAIAGSGIVPCILFFTI